MKNRILLLCIALLVISVKIFSQQNTLSDIQGLSQKENRIFKVNGYMITVLKEKAKLQDKDINKIKKKYDLKNITSEYSDSSLGSENKIIESFETDKDYPDIKAYKLCYLLPQTDKIMDVVLFQSTDLRDTLLEQGFMKLYFDDKLSQYTSDNWVANEVDFVGRRIQLGAACHWVVPHDVQCPGYGEMSWSVFNTEQEAKRENDLYITVKNTVTKKFKILKTEDINIIFEGEATTAKRIAYKVGGDFVYKYLMGGSSILIVYYVVQKVRDNYVSCVLSHYGSNENDYDLAPLLKEVMSLDVQSK